MIKTQLDFSSSISNSAQKQSSLYDRPLRELFDEAREIAEQRYIKQKPEVVDKKEGKATTPTQDEEQILDERAKLKELYKEKAKEQVNENLAQNVKQLAFNQDKNGQAASTKENETLKTLLSMF